MGHFDIEWELPRPSGRPPGGTAWATHDGFDHRYPRDNRECEALLRILETVYPDLLN
jgi:hypothetical protein